MSDANLRSFNLESLKWPTLLRTPSDLVRYLKERTESSLIKAPISTKIVLQIVGGCAYILSHYLNELQVFNKDTFNHELRLIEQNNKLRIMRKQEQSHGGNKSGDFASNHVKSPLITYSNHISCLDDPMLWACLFPWNYYTTQTESIRWSAAATDICFTNRFHSAFFSLGKTFPIVRGVGLKQPGMDFASAILNHHQWLHLFPEGRVMRDRDQNVLTNMDRGYTFKWGISKLILDYLGNGRTSSPEIQFRSIRILPFYHLGLDDIFPVGGSYIPGTGKRITLLIRPTVIDLNQEQLSDIIKDQPVNKAMKSRTDYEMILIKLTNYLEQELEQLKDPTHEIHNHPGQNEV